MDDDLKHGFVSVLDPIENEKENEKKELVTVPYKVNTADFETARRATGTDQSCIFIDYNHKC
jgi:hypothetical protein